MSRINREVLISRSGSKLRFIFLVSIGVLLSISHALAYINPGTASMIWQLMLAALLAIGYATHLYWTQIKQTLQNKLGRITKKEKIK